MADENILAALNDELDGSHMLVLLARPTKHGRRLDWEDLECRPELVTLLTSPVSDDPGILKITATYKVPEVGKLVERTGFFHNFSTYFDYSQFFFHKLMLLS